MNVCMICEQNVFSAAGEDASASIKMLLIKSLVNEGHNVILLLIDRPNRIRTKSIIQGVTVYYFPIKYEILLISAISRYVFRTSIYEIVFSKLGMIRNFSKHLRAIIKKHNIDIIQCESVWTLLPTRGVLSDSIPIVLTVHEVYYKRLMLQYKWQKAPTSIARFFLKIWQKKDMEGVQKSDFCVCLTKKDKEYFIKKGIPERKLSFIPTGVDANMCKPDSKSTQLMEKLEIDIEDFVLLFCASNAFHNEIALERILDIIIPNLIRNKVRFKLLLVGTICNCLKKLQRKYNNYVVSVGFVEDLYLYLNLSDVFVAPIVRDDGIQTKISGALALGKPIICTSAAATGYDIENSVHAIIEDNIDNYHIHILELMRNDGLMKSLRHNARKKALEYDWRVLMREYSSIYDKVMINHHREP